MIASSLAFDNPRIRNVEDEIPDVITDEESVDSTEKHSSAETAAAPATGSLVFMI